MSLLLKDAFPTIPDELRNRLILHYEEIKHNFSLGKFEPSELNGGKFCEIVYRILEWHTSGTYTSIGTTVKDITTKLKNFENKSSFDDSVRFHIPQILCAVYPIRNKRGVAHHANEINPNYMDSAFIVSSSDWVMADLIRIFHQVSIKEAQSVITGITSKKIPTVWQIDTRKRVITPSHIKLKAHEKVLLLLYSEYPKEVKAEDLCTWAEYGNKSRFRSQILKELHGENFIDYYMHQDKVLISPLGLRYVEDNLPLSL